ncbi:unnamed protein product [Paramecium octaurelia]|uniref:Uncharacterized protein n=1 Tax=Paramecium octaurelia TaxID=43137 RepID=A0A8S1UAH1_PAROT|nr:unnamed protein product [Paramecium octaurelia]
MKTKLVGLNNFQLKLIINKYCNSKSNNSFLIQVINRCSKRQYAAIENLYRMLMTNIGFRIASQDQNTLITKYKYKSCIKDCMWDINIGKSWEFEDSFKIQRVFLISKIQMTIHQMVRTENEEQRILLSQKNFRQII